MQCYKIPDSLTSMVRTGGLAQKWVPLDWRYFLLGLGFYFLFFLKSDSYYECFLKCLLAADPFL